MTNSHIDKEYTGTKGRILAWFMSSYLRELLELLWLGGPFPALADMLNLSGKETILDAGCGSGYYSIKLAHRVEQGRVIGVDSSPQMLETFSHRIRNAGVGEWVEAKQGDITALPLKADSVDRAFCALVWHHVHDPQASAREMHRVIKPGGVVVVADFLAKGSGKGAPGSAGHHSAKPFDEAEMRAILESAGFTNVSTRIFRRLVLGRGEKQ
ncbi:MAG: class I SAM-dependent methyltransferase [Nitrospinota bacterium]|nr:class I SAM-dependent methyltransferase [Nitrospinota bacterium]